MLSFLESQQVKFGSIIIMPERIHRQDNEHNGKAAEIAKELVVVVFVALRQYITIHS